MAAGVWMGVMTGVVIGIAMGVVMGEAVVVVTCVVTGFALMLSWPFLQVLVLKLCRSL